VEKEKQIPRFAGDNNVGFVRGVRYRQLLVEQNESQHYMEDVALQS
jgi:hypothetical protein